MMNKKKTLDEVFSDCDPTVSTREVTGRSNDNIKLKYDPAKISISADKSIARVSNKRLIRRNEQITDKKKNKNINTMEINQFMPNFVIQENNVTKSTNLKGNSKECKTTINGKSKNNTMQNSPKISKNMGRNFIMKNEITNDNALNYDSTQDNTKEKLNFEAVNAKAHSNGNLNVDMKERDVYSDFMTEKYEKFKNQKINISKQTKKNQMNDQSINKNIRDYDDRRYYINKTAQSFMKNKNQTAFTKSENRVEEHQKYYKTKPQKATYWHEINFRDDVEYSSDFDNLSERLISTNKVPTNSYDIISKKRTSQNFADNKRRMVNHLIDNTDDTNRLTNSNSTSEILLNRSPKIDSCDSLKENYHFLSRINMKKYNEDYYNIKSKNEYENSKMEAKNANMNKPRVYVHKNEFDMKEKEYAYLQMKRDGKRQYRNMYNYERNYNDENMKRMMFIENERLREEKTLMEAAEGLLLLSKSFTRNKE